MGNAWDTDFSIDEVFVRRLLQPHAHELDLDSLHRLESGWFHVVWATQHHVFRIPSRTGSTLAAQTASALTALAPRLPTQIPTPAWVGEPTPEYSESYVAYRKIHGSLPSRLSWTHEQRAHAALPLARFLRTLHDLPIEMGVNERRPSSLAVRTEAAQKRAAQLASSTHAELAGRAARFMLERTPAPSTRTALCHGDLHAGQVLFDDRHQLVGILDWDTLGPADPAADLSLVYGFLPPSARPAFFEAYGDSEGWERARHLALSYGLAFLAQALADGKAPLEVEAVFGLNNALSDP